MINEKDKATRDSVYANKELQPLWKRFDIKAPDGRLYLSRFVLLRLFGYDLILHKFHLPDLDRCKHDHPWAFASLMLKGGYIEEYEGPNGEDIIRHHKPGRIVINPATHRHKVTELPKGTAWTLLIMSPIRREWGFITKGGWMQWTKFLAGSNEEKIMWCSTPGDVK